MPSVVHDGKMGPALSETIIKQVMSNGFNPGVEIQRGRVSGGVATSEIYVIKGDPVANYTSADLVGVLTAMLVSSNGFLVSAGNIVMPFKERAHGGTFLGATSHAVLSGTNGFAVPTSIKAEHGAAQGATVDFDLHFFAPDGETDPVIITLNQTLDAEVYNASHTLGIVGANGSEVPKVKSAEVLPGYKIEKGMWGSDIYPQEIYIVSVDPQIKITFEDFDSLNTLGPSFASLNSASVNFRKRVDGGTLVSPATTEHVRCSLAGNLSVNEGLSAQEQQNGSASLVLEGLSLTTSVASAETA